MRTHMRLEAAIRTSVAVAFALTTLVAATAAQAAPKDERVDKAVTSAQKAIEACMMDDEGAAFSAYLKLIHPERKSTDRAVGDIKRYSWKRFRKQCRQFIKGDDPKTLEVVRTNPDPIPADAEKFRVFFKPVSNAKRMPAPIIFRKDGDGWLIDTNSM